MDDANQIEPPASIAAIYTSADGSPLRRPAHKLIARYELCDDIAQRLSERAATLLTTSSDSDTEVLKRVRDALGADSQAVTSAESAWVVQRLAELEVLVLLAMEIAGCGSRRRWQFERTLSTLATSERAPTASARPTSFYRL